MMGTRVDNFQATSCRHSILEFLLTATTNALDIITRKSEQVKQVAFLKIF